MWETRTCEVYGCTWIYASSQESFPISGVQIIDFIGITRFFLFYCLIKSFVLGKLTCNVLGNKPMHWYKILILGMHFKFPKITWDEWKLISSLTKKVKRNRSHYYRKHGAEGAHNGCNIYMNTSDVDNKGQERDIYFSAWEYFVLRRNLKPQHFVFSFLPSKALRRESLIPASNRQTPRLILPTRPLLPMVRTSALSQRSGAANLRKLERDLRGWRHSDVFICYLLRTNQIVYRTRNSSILGHFWLI